MKIKTKKIPRYLLTLLLSTSAVLCFGFLSFGGIFALPAPLGLAIASYVFYVLYDGEIEQQNIKSGLKKLLTFDYLEQRMAGEFLKDNLVEILARDDCPAFFHEYAETLKQYSEEGEKADKKKLKIMEEMIALHLFSKKELDEDALDEDKDLRDWIRDNYQQKMLEAYRNRRWKFRVTLLFSMVAGLFTIAGLFYLLAESVLALPFMTAILAIPGAQIPLLCFAAVLVVMASIAYTIKIYNAITDMMNNDSIRSWYYNLRNRMQEGLTLKNVFLVTFSIALVALALFLTGCTAGTWWTIANNAKPFCILMVGKGKQVAAILIGIVHPIIEFFANLFFNIENVSETYTVIESWVDSKDDRTFGEKWNDFKISMQTAWVQLCMRENKAQIFLNIPRMIMLFVEGPVVAFMFLCHLVSASAEGDRAPFIPSWWSFWMEFASEAGEHGHYFLPHSHDLGKGASMQDMLNARFESTSHSHDTNLPLKIIRVIFSPVNLLAALCNYAFSQFNIVGIPDAPKPISLWDAIKKQFGVHDHHHGHHHHHHHDEEDHQQTDDLPSLHADENKPLTAWDLSYVDHAIEQQKAKLEQAVVHTEIAQKKSNALDEFQRNLRANPENLDRPTLAANLKNLSSKPALNQPRFFAAEKTKTQSAIHSLAKSVRHGM